MSSDNKKAQLPLYRVKLPYSSETLLCRKPAELELTPRNSVIVTTRYGKDMAEYLGPVGCPGEYSRRDLQEILREATEDDLKKREELQEKEDEAFGVCGKKIKEHGLEMKLVNTHFLLDEPKILFLFTAESRVDFRELVKDLVAVFRMRIELRQIGVRDESRVLGGLGVCGRTLCCHGITDNLSPVSIKMAKEQNLSLNSMKISGPCGRLLCCLAYEHGFYKDEKRQWPAAGSRIASEQGSHRVLEVNIMTRKLIISGEGGARTAVPFSSLHFDTENKKWSVNLADVIDV